MEIYGVHGHRHRTGRAQGLSAFLGFFDQTLRDHDYDVGRSHAHGLLTNQALNEPGAIGPLRWNPDKNPIRPIDHRLDGLKMSHAPNADLQAFKSSAKSRFNQMLKELIGGWSIVADPAADALVTVVLNQVIAKL